MAWQAKLNQQIDRTPNASTLVVDVSYYDDADAATILHTKVFVLGRGETLNELRGEIVAEGQAVRDAIAQVAKLRSQIPAGTTIAIP